MLRWENLAPGKAEILYQAGSEASKKTRERQWKHCCAGIIIKDPVSLTCFAMQYMIPVELR